MVREWTSSCLRVLLLLFLVVVVVVAILGAPRRRLLRGFEPKQGHEGVLVQIALVPADALLDNHAELGVPLGVLLGLNLGPLAASSNPILTRRILAA